MSKLAATLSELLSDAALFPLLQGTLVVFVLFAVIRNWLHARRAGRGGKSFKPIRGEVSMSRFYATYAAISGLFIAVSLSVDVAKNYRVFWVMLDTTLVAYVCLLNPWFRNTLIGWSAQLTKIE